MDSLKDSLILMYINSYVATGFDTGESGLSNKYNYWDVVVSGYVGLIHEVKEQGNYFYVERDHMV